jgi:hypothetical protein
MRRYERRHVGRRWIQKGIAMAIVVGVAMAMAIAMAA